MVGERGQCHFDHPSEKIRENSEYEHAGTVFFYKICGQREGTVFGTFYLGEGKVQGITGNLSCDNTELCQY